MNLVLLEPAEVARSGEAALGGARAGHLIEVLGVAPGHTIRIGLIDGPMGTGTVVAAGGGTVRLQCAFDSHLPEVPRVDLLIAVPRPKVMRRLWAQLAAIGVGRIILTNAERVERHYFDTHILTEPSYRPLLVEGLQQARDTRLPRVSIHRRFRVVVEDELNALVPDSLRVVAHPGEPLRLLDAIDREGPRRVLVAIGPEGGWNAFELEMLQSHGFLRIGLGPRALRTDTACIALLSLVHEAIRR